MTADRELRSQRGAITAQEGKLVGYAAVFGSRSQDLGGFVEVIAPGAFTRTLDHGGDVVVSFNHDVNLLLGRTSSGTARLSVDEVGLRYEVDVPDTSLGKDVLELARRGDLNGSSFTFSTTSSGSEWSTDDNGVRVRTLTEVRLFELGPVVSPAYLDTSVAARSLEALEAESGVEEEEHTEDLGELVSSEEKGEDGEAPSEEARYRRPRSFWLR